MSTVMATYVWTEDDGTTLQETLGCRPCLRQERSSEASKRDCVTFTECSSFVLASHFAAVYSTRTAKL